MTRRSWLLGITAAALAACSVYGPDLVGGGGGTTTGTGGATSTSSSSSTTGSSSTGGGGSTTSSTSSNGMPCTTSADCSGMDTECQQRTCTSGACGVANAQSGTMLLAQTKGDCKVAVCDGNGGTTTMADDGDVADDGKECTTDGCSAGSPTHVPVTAGTACSSGGGKVCSATGDCVECVTGTDCATLVCKMNLCVAQSCTDLVRNGSETDVDCGGTCPPCAFGKKCGTSSDCKGQSCVGGTCAATCTDGAKNGAETDVDCGGGTCPACASGKGCSAGSDCQSGKCTGGTCLDVLLISELQTRGTNGGSDEFLEIYNPNAYPVTFDSGWEIWSRNATSACAALNKRFAGSGQMIPSHGHLLFTNASTMGYNGAVTGDSTYTTGFSDSGQVVLLHGGALVDSLCYYFNTTTQGNLTCATPPAMWFACQGAGVSNLPHNDTTGGSSNTDVSMERKPGGAAGNGQSTGDNTADWSTMVAPNPQNVMSAPAP